MGKLNIFLAITAVVVIGMGSVFFLGKDAFGFGSEKKPSVEDIVELSVDTDVITTNLASNNFAVVQFNILLDSKEAKAELDMRKPEVRAAVIAILAGFTKDQLTGREGIANLEEELYAKLEAMVESGRVERVLVTEFKVQ
ncbi:flagellar basal body-associated protein FliL [Mesobacillus campisalis]|uniref:Flagellar protein FliL n=1 Tax=Mesobacillus campisalis TaxID=1408103 RepID=A0A0M2SWP5_9BACI|nr:flagellar basal body-associated FliL family protein [Mesobacillus campisalis]KKK38984.1 flagellar basal body-associated protein FliL [Mesobacillus campisalis]